MSNDGITVYIPGITLKKEWEEIEHKLGHLLIEDVIFCNNGWWYLEEGTPWKKDAISMHVNCNDIFAWGCADSEDITFSEISELYEMWKLDPNLGPAAWCIKKRKQLPQTTVLKQFEKSNIWNLQELLK